MKRAAALLVLAATTAVEAEPRLRITHEPPPRSLKMRPKVVAQTPSATRTTTPMPAAPPPISRAVVPVEDQGVALRDLRQKVSFSIDLGYTVEAANPTGKATLGARAPVVEQDYAALRSYGFGEAFASTRGLGWSSLSTYFAVRFQAARRLEYRLPTGQDVPVAPPIATWFERSGLEPRYGWAEVKDFLPKHWGLSRLRVRVGGQHIYGPWVTHVDGMLVSYDGSIVTASAYGGVRHSDYTREQSDKRPGVLGSSLRFDLRGLPKPLPIALQGEILAYGKSDEAGQPASRSALLQTDWRPGRDVALIGQVRVLDGRAASQRLEVRARYRQVTNLVFDLMHRTEADWRWDPSLTAPDTNDAVAARRYLDLGPVVPQLMGSVRAGTLIAENIDLLLRGAFASKALDEDAPVTSFAAPYVEMGGALEIRLRRTVALGASLLTRNTDHEPLLPPITDMRGVAQPLPSSEHRGEDGFTEVGASAKMSLGARKFSSVIELYGRRTRYAQLYADPTLPVIYSDVRLGGRVTLDAWVGKGLRLFAAYDASSAIDLAPEISGYRSLRLMMSGVY